MPITPRRWPLSTLLLPIVLLAAAAGGARAAPPVSSTPAARATLQAAIGAMLQGDGPQARRRLTELPAQALSGADQRFRACMLGRLSGTAPAGAAASASAAPDPFAAQVLRLYRRYWQAAVAQPATRAAQESRLQRGLATALGGPAPRDMDDTEARLSARLAQLGLHAQLGTTGRLRDLMLWSRQTERAETVTLPEGSQTTRVTYLDGFLSQGWSNHLSCERVGTGGWATTAGLYVIVPGYASLEDETFRVNFLAHESQHYADQHRYPQLQGWELEYRAKLVELAYADETRAPTLAAFGANQGDDAAEPHSHANRRVLVALRERLQLAPNDPLTAVPRERLQQAALAELKADSAKRTPGAR
jgi:hypothetical protein